MKAAKKRAKKRKKPARKFPPQVYDQDEMDRLLNAPSRRAPTGIRNRALLYIGYRGGLRLSEALSLYPKDVNTKDGIVQILQGKGKKSRTVGLSQDACLAIDRWLDKRRQLDLNGRQPLFCTLDGQRIKTPYIRALMKRLAVKAKIEKRLNFHSLRHTFARDLYRSSGHNDLIVGRALGHARLDTTRTYIDHLHPLEVIAEMKKLSQTRDAETKAQ